MFNKIISLYPKYGYYEKYIIEVRDDTWGQKVGGLTTKRLKHGFFDQAYTHKSTSWKSKGGKMGTRNWHIRMKKENPAEYSKIQYNRIKQSLKYKHDFKGQKYRNLLELEVAKILDSQGYKFEYERQIKCGDKFYFPDFSIGNIMIECTFWYNVEQKAEELSQKIKNYQQLNRDLIIVTTKRFLKDYSRMLANLNVRVITPDSLTELLDGKNGRVRALNSASSKLSTDRAPAFRAY